MLLSELEFCSVVFLFRLTDYFHADFRTLYGHAGVCLVAVYKYREISQFAGIVQPILMCMAGEHK